MKSFTYERANTPADAAAAVARTPGAKFIAGGTNLLDLMKLQIEAPTHLVDVNRLKLDRIEPTPEGGLRVGALVRNTDLAADERVRRDYEDVLGQVEADSGDLHRVAPS
jgi:xanthine dehydrogenase YagS FAD-binding subunit